MRDRTQKTQKRFPRWWIAFKPRYRETAFLFTSSFVVFGLLFAIGNPPVVAYLLLLDVIWGAVFLCTKRGKTKLFFIAVLEFLWQAPVPFAQSNWHGAIHLATLPFGRVFCWG